MQRSSLRYLGYLAFLGLGLGLNTVQAATGAELYKSSGCATCHGANGQGVPGLAPPLKGNDFVTGSAPAQVAEVIVKGRTGGNKKYKEYQGIMPAHSFLRGEKVEVLTKYLREDLQK